MWPIRRRFDMFLVKTFDSAYWLTVKVEKLRSSETSGTAPQMSRRRIAVPHCSYTYLHLPVSLSLSHIPSKLSPSLSSFLPRKLSIMCARWKGRQFYSRIQNRPLIGTLQFSTSVLVASPYLSASFDVMMTRQMATADKLVQIASRGHCCSNDGAMTVQNLQRHRR